MLAVHAACCWVLHLFVVFCFCGLEHGGSQQFARHISTRSSFKTQEKNTGRDKQRGNKRTESTLIPVFRSTALASARLMPTTQSIIHRVSHLFGPASFETGDFPSMLVTGGLDTSLSSSVSVASNREKTSSLPITSQPDPASNHKQIPTTYPQRCNQHQSTVSRLSHSEKKEIQWENKGRAILYIYIYNKCNKITDSTLTRVFDQGQPDSWRTSQSVIIS